MPVKFYSITYGANLQTLKTYNMKNFLLFLIFLFTISCGVKQPLENVDRPKPALLFIDSNPQGALIFLDNELTNKITPDSLTVNPGLHYIQVALNGYKTHLDSILIQGTSDSVYQIHSQLTKITSFGNLIIETIPANALVVIDGSPQSKSTPDTFKLEPGNHSILIKKNGYKDIPLSTEISENQQVLLKKSLQTQKAVLYESFANVSCEPCVKATENLETFSNSNNDSTFYILEYFANWPSANDPFYLVAPSDVYERLMLYHITVLPGLRSSGSWTNPYSASDIMDSYTENMGELNGEIGVSITKLIKNDSLIVDVELYQHKEVTNPDQLLLFCAITENDISFDTPPGSNGLTHFNWVFRGFLSDKKGDSFSFKNSQFNTNFTLQWNSNWDYSNIKIIAFIQDKDNRLIKYVSGI